MARINLLPWRDELREKRKKEFIVICAFVAILAVLGVVAAWMFFDNKLIDQNDANTLISTTNQDLDQQLKSLEGLQEQRDAIVERMKLIQGLQGQRPVAVRLIDELVRVTPQQMHITKFVRQGDKFTIEGRAESPNTVAELLRSLEASTWYRNAFMNSFLAAEENKDKPASSIVPRLEDRYGSFVVSVDLDEIVFDDLSADVDEPAASQPVVATTEVKQ